MLRHKGVGDSTDMHTRSFYGFQQPVPPSLHIFKTLTTSLLILKQFFRCKVFKPTPYKRRGRSAITVNGRPFERRNDCTDSTEPWEPCEEDRLLKSSPPLLYCARETIRKRGFYSSHRLWDKYSCQLRNALSPHGNDFLDLHTRSSPGYPISPSHHSVGFVCKHYFLVSPHFHGDVFSRTKSSAWSKYWKPKEQASAGTQEGFKQWLMDCHKNLCDLYERNYQVSTTEKKTSLERLQERWRALVGSRPKFSDGGTFRRIWRH